MEINELRKQLGGNIDGGYSARKYESIVIYDKFLETSISGGDDSFKSKYIVPIDESTSFQSSMMKILNSIHI